MEQFPMKLHVAKAREHFNKGRENYIGFCIELAAAYREGEATQEELGVEFDMSQPRVNECVKVGSDPRIIGNTDNLPKSSHAIYLLTTLPDAAFEELAKPETTQARIKEWKAAQQPKKAKQHKEDEEMKTTFSTGAILIEYGLISGSNHGDGTTIRKMIRERFGDAPFESEQAFREVCEQLAAEKDIPKAKQEAQKQRDSLPKSAQERFDRAVRKWEIAKIAEMRQLFQEQLQEAIAAKVAELDERDRRTAQYEAEAKAEREAAVQHRLGIDSHMSQDEFNLIRNCLHPDRAPVDRRERFEKAFVVFNKLEKTVNTKLPIVVLRERGWERVSPHYKPH